MSETNLQQNIAFPRLTDAELNAVKKFGTTRTLQDGEHLFSVHADTDGFFVVLAGALEVVDLSGDQARTITVHQPGDFTGTIGVVKQWHPIADGVARGDSEVLQIPSAALRRLIVERPALGEKILKAFIARWDLLLKSGFEGPRIIGSERDRHAFQLREFLARNQIPFTWIGLESQPEVAPLLEHFGLAGTDLPAVVCGLNPLLRNPSIRELAEAIGLKRPFTQHIYDLIVVGAGPSGLAAAVYGTSEGLSTLVLDGRGPGGQAGASMKIENYLGFPTGITGSELMGRALLQAQKFGAEFSTPSQATGLDLSGTLPAITIDGSERVEARCVLIATGADYNKLDVPGGEQFAGVGLYYAATPIELAACRGAEVIVVGGGNSAGQAIVFLAQSTRKVRVLLRGGDLRKSMSSYLVERIEATDNVEVLTHSEIREMHGDGVLQAVVVENTQTGAHQTIATPAVFSFIGAVPRTDWLPADIEKDAKGFLCTGRNVTDAHWTLKRQPFLLETSHPGVFAAGDVRLGSVKRCAAGVGEGSMAIAFVHQYLSSLA